MYFNSKNKVGLFDSENKQIEQYDVYQILKDYQQQFPEEMISKISIRLRANKEIPIEFIKNFELEILKLGQRSIIYEVENNNELTSNFYNNQIKHQISSSLLKVQAPIGETSNGLIWKVFKESNFQDTLRLHISNRIKVNGHEMPLEMLFWKLKDHINKATIIEYIYADGVTFQDYINVLSIHKKAVWELRSTENYNEIDSLIHRYPFQGDEELIKERTRIKEKYPILIIERFE